MMNFVLEFCQRVPWGWENLTWTVGGIVPSLTIFFYRILRAGLDDKSKPWIEVFRALKGRLINLQRLSRAYQIVQHHYDMGNTLFECMLDRRLIYNCGYWENATSLDEAQEAKLD